MAELSFYGYLFVYRRFKILCLLVDMKVDVQNYIQ